MELRFLHRDEVFIILLLLAVSVWASLQFAIRADRWFSVEAFDIHDASRWQDVTIDYQRTIARDFPGVWWGKVRRQGPDGWVAYAATAPHAENYETIMKLPNPVKLDWMLWTEPRAYALPCGTYQVTVYWLINPESWLFRREISRTDTFTIWGETECPTL